MDFNANAEQYAANASVEEYGRTAFTGLQAAFPEALAAGPGSTALDFGTGGGSIAFQLRSAGFPVVVALDPAENMIRIVRRRAEELHDTGMVPWVGDAASYLADCDPNLPKQFDIITASSVIGFISDKVATVKALASMLRAGSGLLVHWDWRKTEDSEDGMTADNIKALHRACGLQTVHLGVAFSMMEMDVLCGVAKRKAS